jgi:tRNA pseudouridine38-40 synthase
LLKNFKAKIAYQGDGFCGFGIQDGVVTVQGEIEKAIKKVTGKAVRVHPAGRTDGGVHAVGQVISFKVATHLAADKLKNALNAYLPASIAVLQCEAVPVDFHARYSARSRTYVYNLLLGDICPMYLSPYVWHLKGPLDLKSMQTAARILVGRHDFASFSIKEEGKHCLRQMKSINFCRSGVKNHIGGEKVLKVKLITLTFKANAYARGMIRGIVGTLVLVGQKKLSFLEFKKVFMARDRCRAGKTAPAKGLCLLGVGY